MIRNVFFSFLICWTFFSCSTSKTSLYSWYGLENNFYQYIKKQDDSSYEKLIESIDMILCEQKGIRNVAPPGVYAERGYILIKQGKIEDGLTYLKKEIEVYPESEVLISRIIKQFEE